MSILPEDDEDIGCVPCCGSCGSQHVVKDAWANWNPETGLWELEAVFDFAFCHACEEETRLEWARLDAVPDQRLRTLNDRFRRQGVGHGALVITAGIKALGQEFVRAAIRAVSEFDAFTDDNDPWGEHDYGAVEVKGEKIFFKLDYYADQTMSAGSENPANEGMTFRVLTIMLVSEY